MVRTGRFSNPIHLIRSNAIPYFSSKVLRCRSPIDHLWLVSPWFSIIHEWKDYQDGFKHKFDAFYEKIKTDEIPVTIISRKPIKRKSHLEFVSKFEKVDSARIIFQPNLHAKIYICDNVEESFALIGSPNFTKGSLSYIELGIFIRGFNEGTDLIYDLTDTCKEISRIPGFEIHKKGK